MGYNLAKRKMKKVALFLTLLCACFCLQSCKKDCICTKRVTNSYGEEKVSVINEGKMKEKTCKKLEYEKDYEQPYYGYSEHRSYTCKIGK